MLYGIGEVECEVWMCDLMWSLGKKRKRTLPPRAHMPGVVQVTLWVAFQRLAAQKRLVLEREMHQIRDRQLRDPGFAEVCAIRSFGSIFQPIEDKALALHAVQSDKHKWKVDHEIFPRLVCMCGEDYQEEFSSILRDALPNTTGHEIVTIASEHGPYRSGAIHLLIGPVKKHERVTAKVKEYEGKGKSAWPFTQNVRGAAAWSHTRRLTHARHFRKSLVRSATCCVRP